MSPKLIRSRDVSVPPLVGARFIVPSLDFAHGNRVVRFSKAERKAQTVLQDFSYCWLSAVDFPQPILLAPYSLSTALYSLSSQFTMRRSEASACRASEYRGSTSSAS